MGLLVDFRALGSDLLARYRFARQVGMTFGNKRDVWGVLGYPSMGGISTRDFIERYERGGIAGRIVDVLPDATWRGELWLEEVEDPDTETAFEKAWVEFEKQFALRQRFHQVDTLSRLSSYAILLIGTRDGNLSEPLPKNGKVIYLQPYLGAGGPARGHGTPDLTGFEADATIHEYDVDASSPRFGLPLTYQLRRGDIESNLLGKPIHWTRVIHVAEGTLRDDVFGRPALERVWNHLEDLDKVVGGGSEAFWMRANAGLHINVDKDMQITDTSKTELQKLQEQAEEYQHQLTRMLRTRGVDITQLGSDVANFQSPADVIITLIAGATGIPKRLLVGSERGELASTQDRENFRDLINGRQTNFAAPSIVRPLVDRLIEYGYLPTPKEYRVKWPTIEVMGETEKASGATSWASVNSTMSTTVFTPEEIRDKWAGLKPLTKEQKEQIEEEAAKKLEEQKELMKTKNPPDEDDEEEEDEDEEPKGKSPRAAEEGDDHDPMVRILEEAIAHGATDVVSAIVGLGGPGSGNYGHSGRPGQVGGSTSRGGAVRAYGPGETYPLVGSVGNQTGIVSEKGLVLANDKGRIYLEDDGDALVVRNVRVGLREQNLGYGTALYEAASEEAVKRGRLLRSMNKGRNADTQAIWDKFAAQKRVRKGDSYLELLPKSSAISTEMQHEIVAAFVDAYGPDWMSAFRDWQKSNPLRAAREKRMLGGPGSGNHGHAGRPGHIGGSASKRGALHSKPLGALEDAGFVVKHHSAMPQDAVAGMNPSDAPVPLSQSAVEGIKAGLADLEREAPALHALIKKDVPFVYASYEPPAGATSVVGPGGAFIMINGSDTARASFNNEEAKTFNVAAKRATQQGLTGGDWQREVYRGIVVHEAAHIADAYSNGSVTKLAVENLILAVPQNQIEDFIKKNVSPYAAYSPNEFGAEVFTAAVQGVKIAELDAAQRILRKAFK